MNQIIKFLTFLVLLNFGIFHPYQNLVFASNHPIEIPTPTIEVTPTTTLSPTPTTTAESSATPTQTQSSSPTPTIKKSPTPTVRRFSPTPSSALTPTATPSTTITPTLTLTPTPTKTGFFKSVAGSPLAIIITVLGIILAGVSLYLYRKKKKLNY